MALDVQISDRATPALKALLLRVSGRRGHAVIGQAVRMLLRTHLRAKEAQPNKQGWPKTHFYARARDRVNFEADEDSATVRVSLVGFRQRYYGGPIRPVNRRTLAIPAAPQAYGKLPAEFGALDFQGVFRGRYVGNLVAPDGQVLFRLLRAVNQPADPSVIPTESEMVGAATAALARVVQAA